MSRPRERARLVAAAVAAAAVAAPSVASAHQAIIGTVYAPHCGPGESPAIPVPGASVFARLTGSSWVAGEERSDRHGRYRLDLPPGRYVLALRWRDGTTQPYRYRVTLRRHRFPYVPLQWVQRRPCASAGAT